MKILVVNGSPKGADSITLHTALYLQKLYPAHSFTILHAGQRIKALEKDFSPAIAALNEAEMVLFAYPVYTFLAPSQLHRFIELVKEHKVNLRGKYCTQITTSKHFYDVTAHRYIQDNAQEMGMKFLRGLSADMDDLPTKEGQREARAFFERVMQQIAMNYAEPNMLLRPNDLFIRANVPQEVAEKTEGDIVIIADLAEDDAPLKAMIDRFRAVAPYRTRVFNLRTERIDGGCLGCFQCAATGKCIYKDGFDETLRTSIQTAQAMIYAFTIRDHSLGARFKMYNDRQFCNGHRTVTMGMPVGYLICGSYATEMNVQMVCEGRTQVGGNVLAGIATNERCPDREIDALAGSLQYVLENDCRQPKNFYGVGGMKIFRDLIYTMRGLMRADHKFFKSHGQYDFPQKHPVRIAAMYLVGAMMRNKKLMRKAGGKMTEGMAAPYKKVLDELDKQQPTGQTTLNV